MEVKIHQVISAKYLEFSFEDFWCHMALEMTVSFAELWLSLDGCMYSEESSLLVTLPCKYLLTVYLWVPLWPFCQGTWRLIMNFKKNIQQQYVVVL